jgi:aspartyl aminopeptidase
VTRRIVATLGCGDYETALARSMMLSADNAHGVHPNHPEKYDENNRVALNGGVVVKFNAAQKYTSDGVSQAVFEEICRRADVPGQRFANRSDIPGGSTLGNIANTHASMITVDIGLAQLSMHAANESAGVHDLAHMIRAMRAFHETEVVIQGDGRIRLMGLE